MTKHVLGVGHACIDQVLIWENGQAPVQDNKLIQYEVEGGGMVATALVAVTRLGGEAEFWGVVGDEPLGDHILHGLRKENVNVEHVLKIKDKEGPVSIVCVDEKTGDRCFYSGKPISDPLEPFGDLDRVAEAGCLIIDGARFVAARPAAQQAQKLGIPVVGDICWISKTTPEMLTLLDYAIVPETYAEMMGFGEDLEGACKSLCKQGAKIGVITCGGDGLIYSDGTTIERLEAFHVPIVDTTGAGDTFHGSFCFGLIKGLELRDNLIFSSAVASLKCGKIGGRSGIPKLEDVADFLRDNKKDIQGIT